MLNISSYIEDYIADFHKVRDKEAIRLVLSLPSFSPGRNALGEPIDVWYTLPVTFKVPGF